MYSPRFGLGYVTERSQAARVAYLQKQHEAEGAEFPMSASQVEKVIDRRFRLAGIGIVLLMLAAFVLAALVA